MKRTIIIAIALLWQGFVFAQCDDKGISTDPDNLQNPACPDLKNDFEWRTTKTIML